MRFLRLTLTAFAILALFANASTLAMALAAQTTSSRLSARADLTQYSPALSALYLRYISTEVPILRRYAVQQGFTEAHEQLAVTVHELIHIESARIGAYWIAGQGYEGYQPAFWPPLTARRLVFTQPEKAQLGVIYDNYVRRNPTATLRNVLDELNAYSETAGFVCRYSPAADDGRQTRPLLGHLALANAFLEAYPAPTRQALCSKQVTKGIIAMLVSNSYRALSQCHVRSVGNQGAIQKCLQ